MILLVGGSGTLGNRVAHQLLHNGISLRVGSRDPESKLYKLAGRGAETVKLDVRDTASLERAFKGVDEVIVAIQAIYPPSWSNNIETVDNAGNKALIDIAKKEGVGHFVLVSNTLASSEAPSRFGKAKYAAEEYLKQSGLTYTIVRPTAYIETNAIKILGDPLLKLGRVRFLGSGRTRLNWISVEDVAGYITRIFDYPALKNKCVTLGGPDSYSRMEALEIFEDLLGIKAKRSHISVGVMRFLELITRPFHPGLSSFIQVNLMEEIYPDFEGNDPEVYDWIGPTTFRQVVDDWGIGRARPRQEQEPMV